MFSFQLPGSLNNTPEATELIISPGNEGPSAPLGGPLQCDHPSGQPIGNSDFSQSSNNSPAHPAYLAQGGMAGSALDRVAVPDWDIAARPILQTASSHGPSDLHAGNNPFIGPVLGSLLSPPSAVLTQPQNSTTTSGQQTAQPSLSALHAFTAMLPTPRHSASPAPIAAPSHQSAVDHAPDHAPQAMSRLKKKGSKKSAVNRLNEEAEPFQPVARRTRRGRKQ